MNPQALYYPGYSEYQMTMNDHQFHDSGIVDEGLSDETGSIEDETNQKENHSTDDHDIPKKPSQSYLEIIAEAILKTPNRTMQLFEIYTYFQRKYRYFAEDVNKSWRNSVRHNLSLNDCFIKAGRGSNGKGHYWRIHDLAVKDFEQGRFRRRRYRQQMRQLQMQTASYDNSPVTPYYPSNSYYMCSPPPPYHAVYPPNTTESPSNFYMSTSTPTSYSCYDPYASSYYPNTLSYTSPIESTHFDA